MIPLALVPGMMCDARLFGPQIEALSASATIEFATITAYDTIDELAADVLENALPEFGLCGLSMGGIVAMEMMEQAPERIAGLALLDTNPKAETAEVVRAGNLRSGKCAAAAFWKSCVTRLSRIILPMPIATRH